MRHSFTEYAVRPIVERSFDADRINALVNDPTIRPFIGGDISESLDLSAAISDDRNVFLIGEHGGFALSWCGPGDYEVHTFAMPEGRGQWAISAALYGIDFMASVYGAQHIWTRIKPEARHTKLFARAVGLKWCGKGMFDLGIGPETFLLYDWRTPCPQPQ